jgi:Tfp pilus assembly protein PilE
MRPKLKILGTVLIVIIVAVVIGLLAGRTSKPSTKAGATKTPAVVSNNDLLTELKTKLDSKYDFLSSTAIDTSNDLGYPIPGQNFDLVLPVSSDSSLSFEDKNTNNESAVYSALSSTTSFFQTYFKINGYASAGNTEDSSFLSSSIYYQNSSQVCQITIYSLLDITCDTKNQISSVAATAEPLIQAYRNESSDTGLITITEPSIRNSQTTGYHVATMNIGNSSGQIEAYYYSLNNSVWIMVNPNWYNDPHEDGDIMPNCEDFESDLNIDRAFAGFSCYDSANRVTTIIKS